jgi:CO/xanthine dehydrogenase Mo-binding subunit
LLGVMSQGTVKRIPWASGVRAAVANAVAAAVGPAAARRVPVTAPRIKAALRGIDP